MPGSSSQRAQWKSKLKAIGKTQAQLASELKMSQSELSKVLLNRRSAKESSVAVVAAYFEGEEMREEGGGMREKEEEEDNEEEEEEEEEDEKQQDASKGTSITDALNASTAALIGTFTAKKNKKKKEDAATDVAYGVDNTRHQKRAKTKSSKAISELQERVKGETARNRNAVLEQRGLSSAFERASYLDRESNRERKRKVKVTAPNAGKGWYGMQAPEMDDRLKRDLAAIRLRGYADPKRFYKASDGTPRVFQVGTVVASAAEGGSGRLTRKERKQTVLEDIAASSDSLRYTKKTFGGIAKSKQSRAKANRKVNGKRKRGYY